MFGSFVILFRILRLVAARNEIDSFSFDKFFFISSAACRIFRGTDVSFRIVSRIILHCSTVSLIDMGIIPYSNLYVVYPHRIIFKDG